MEELTIDENSEEHNYELLVSVDDDMLLIDMLLLPM